MITFSDLEQAFELFLEKNPHTARRFLDQVVKHLPKNYMDNFVTNYYISKVHKGNYYVVYPLSFPNDKMYFTSFKEVVLYVREWTGKEEDVGVIRHNMTRNIPTEGLMVYKKEEK